MASKISRGTALRGPDGETAVRMGPGVTAGQFFVIHPDNGGYYATEAQVEEIEVWPSLVEPKTTAKEEAK